MKTLVELNSLLLAIVTYFPTAHRNNGKYVYTSEAVVQGYNRVEDVIIMAPLEDGSGAYIPVTLKAYEIRAINKRLEELAAQEVLIDMPEDY